MTKRKKKTKKINDDLIVRYLYAVIFITISIIAFLHDYTGVLGSLLCNCSRFLFGYIWFIPYLALIAVGIYMALNKSVRMNKYVIAGILLFIAGLFACSIPSDISITGNRVFDDFIVQAKEVYEGTAAAKGGIIGVTLYALFSRLIDFVGTMIMMSVLIVIAAFVLLGDGTFENFINTLKAKQHNKKALASSKKNNSVSKKNNNGAFIELPENKGKKFTLLKLNEKENKKKNVNPIINNSDIANSPYNNNRNNDLFKEQTEKTPAVEEKSIKIEPVKAEKIQVAQTIAQPVSGIYNADNYKLPKIMLLESVGIQKKNSNKINAMEKWNELEEILESFGLDSDLQAYNIGPSVTQFEIVPKGNFNIRKYSTIEENIKMQLAVKDVRIEAPIPGKKAVGIEIPNEERVPVRLKELLANIPSEFADQPLTMALGKDLTGKGVFARIDKMPHLLIAGSTGSGKSVCINSIILAILFRARPDQVKLIMVDPKKVEFTPYVNIPHLACPIINDTSKAAEALKKLVVLMEQRYDLFSRTGCRNIGEYNKQAEKKLCNIVIIIDELADLMTTHGKEVEQYIARLAAMARASGIYMILATQRPSTDVITGTIKNNIPSRIAFAVGSSIDSRTIIDRAGAEALFGNGDMLFMPSGMNSPKRVQGVYVSDEEIKKVTQYFVDSHYIPQYEDIFIIDENSEDGATGAAQCEDPLYEDIKKWVCTLKTISASGLQRRYGLGFPRAAKLIDALEQEGVISGSNGSKPRDVLVKNDEQQ